MREALKAAKRSAVMSFGWVAAVSPLVLTDLLTALLIAAGVGDMGSSSALSKSYGSYPEVGIKVSINSSRSLLNTIHVHFLTRI